MITAKSIQSYDAVVIEAHGPEEGLAEEITYDAIVVNTSDTVQVAGMLPTRSKPDGAVIRRAPKWFPCKIVVAQDEAFLFIQEEDAITDCAGGGSDSILGPTNSPLDTNLPSSFQS